MNKADLVRILANKLNRTKAETREAIETLTDEMTTALQKGDRVYLRGFGSLKKETRKARRVRNVETGKMITIPERDTVDFTPFPILLRKIKK